MRIERAGKPYDEGADDKGDQPLADNIDSGGAGSHRLVAGGAKRQTGAGNRVEIRDRDGARGAQPSDPDIHGSRRSDDTTLAACNGIPVRIDVVDDAQQSDGSDRGGYPR